MLYNNDNDTSILITGIWKFSKSSDTTIHLILNSVPSYKGGILSLTFPLNTVQSRG